MKVRFILVAILGAAVSAAGATFVVRTDRDLIRRSEAIVVGTPLTSYTTESGSAIETVTVLSVEEVIKGAVLDSTINIVEPGGVYGNRATAIPGVPRFETGSRVLLFLMKTGPSRWAVFDLVVGKFEFAEDQIGEKVLIRDEADIVGWDPDLTPHRELRRSAERFLRFVRTEARNGLGQTNYNVRTYSLRSTSASTSLQPAPLAAFSATSYTFSFDGTPTGMGGRRNVFPSAVTFFQISTEPGASGTPAGATAIQTGMNSWNGDCLSNMNYVYGGLDTNQSRTGGVTTPDAANDVYYEQDLSAFGPPFVCGSGGLLGVGGITAASGSHSFNGETFFTAVEGDVQMNKGIANCTSLFTSGDFNTAVTHELGHTLGFRHADQNRPGNAACSTDPSLECSTLAVMRSYIPSGINAALQPWDINAARAVYAGGACHNPKTTGIFRPTSAAFFLKNTNATGYADILITYGNPSDLPIAGDWNGDRVDTVGIFRAGTFFLKNTNATGYSDISFWFGAAGDLPIAGDWNGDGIFTVGIYRNGTFYLRNSNSSGPPDLVFSFGQAGDIPLAGDWDGDGIWTVGVYRPSTGQFFLRNSNTAGYADIAFAFGGDPNDRPVAGDWNGDGITTVGVYRNGTFLLRNTNSSGPVDLTFNLGNPGDLPVSGDWDGLP